MDCMTSHILDALEAADECLALIDDVGHGAHMDNVTIARKSVTSALQLFETNVKGHAPLTGSAAGKLGKEMKS